MCGDFNTLVNMNKLIYERLLEQSLAIKGLKVKGCMNIIDQEELWDSESFL